MTGDPRNRQDRREQRPDMEVLDHLNPDNSPDNLGFGKRRIYTHQSYPDMAVELLTAYKWHLSGIFILLFGTWLLGWWSVPSITLPPEAISMLVYFCMATAVAYPFAGRTVKWWDSPQGQEILEFNPIGNSHRHLRIGSELWDDLIVRSPWGEQVTTNELQHCSVNGASGYELMDLRVPENGPPQCVATWMGEASGSMLRTYQMSVRHARRRLAKDAYRNLGREANRENIVREAAERVIVDMIRTSEDSGIPSGDEIRNAVDDVMDSMEDMDPMMPDRVQEQDGYQPGGSDASNGTEPERETRTNGHRETENGLGDLFND